MLADDLLGRIALDPLAADVPARHDAGRADHIERVVRDTFDKKTETAFALEQIPLLPLFLIHQTLPDRAKRLPIQIVPRAMELFSRPPRQCLTHGRLFRIFLL